MWGGGAQRPADERYSSSDAPYRFDSGGAHRQPLGSYNRVDDAELTTTGDDHYSQIVGLRDRLARAARSDRPRCLDVAEGKNKSSPGAIMQDANTQTDPVAFATVSSAVGPSLSHNSVATGVWSAEDESAQVEALRTISMLVDTSQARAGERATDLEAQLRAERASSQELETHCAHERSRKEAAQQQILCLEYELDGKEAALQVAERTLERRDSDLQQAQLQLRSLQECNSNMAASYASGSGTDDARLASLKGQLELKDQHIARLLNVLSQHRKFNMD